MAAPRNRSPGFSRRAQAGVFVGYVATVGGLMVAAVLLATWSFDPRAFSALRGGVAELTTPVSSFFAGISRGILSVPSSINAHFAVMARNAALEQRLHDLRGDIIRIQSTDRENRRLRALLGVRDRSSGVVVAARIVSSSASSTRRFAVLNAGTRQGVAIGQPVRGPEGLIGRVFEAGPNTARVLLLADPESIVPVRRPRDGMPAIAAGRGDGLIEIRAITLGSSDFQPGDLLVTSGVGGIFPPDIPVARVVGRTADGVVARTVAVPDTIDIAIVQRTFMPVMDAAGAAR